MCSRPTGPKCRAAGQARPGCHPDNVVGALRDKADVGEVTESCACCACFSAPRNVGRGGSCAALIHMSDPDRYDDTADDHERFEAELVAQDRDVRSPSMADLDDETARQMV